MKVFKRCKYIFLFLSLIQVFFWFFSAHVFAGRYIDGGVDIYHDFDIVNRRKGRYTITDDTTYFYQQYDTIRLEDTIGYNRYDLLQLNMKTLVLIFQIDIAEKDDGYQEFYVFSQSNLGQPILHASLTNFEHGSGYKNTTFTRYEFYCELVIDNIGDEIFIGYGAHGSSSDTWINENLELQICMSKEEQRKTGLYWIVNGV